jgi:hypothetical protein
MRTIVKTLTRLAFALSIIAAARSAEAAEGLLTKPTALPAAARASIQKEIDAARAADPATFAAVRSVRGVRPEFYRKARNPAPTATRELKALGKAALFPILNELAFDAQPPANLTTAEWTALAAGMLEAVGAIRDARSAPVLTAIFDGPAHDAAVVRAAGEALGQLCGDAELATLIKHDTAADPRREGAILGLGQCMRVEAATHLATTLAGATDEATAAQASRALGLVGSSWAWASLGPKAKATGDAVREIAARALVPALSRHGGAARKGVVKAMLMVDHPVLPGLLMAARGTASPEVVAIIDVVQKQLGKK